MRIAVCDGSDYFLTAFRKEMANYDASIEFDTFSTYEELLSSQAVEELDGIFMSTEIGGRSGIEPALELKHRNRNIEVMFVTEQCEKYAQKIFYYVDKLRPFAFFVKPMSRPLMRHFLGLLEYDVMLRRSTIIQVRDMNGEMIGIPSETIFYISYFDRVTQICCTDGTVKTRQTIPQFDVLLNKFRYLHISKSCIVNADFVDSVSSGEIIMSNGDRLYSSRNYKKQFAMLYKDYLSKKRRLSENLTF